MFELLQTADFLNPQSWVRLLTNFTLTIVSRGNEDSKRDVFARSCCALRELKYHNLALETFVITAIGEFFNYAQQADNSMTTTILDYVDSKIRSKNNSAAVVCILRILQNRNDKQLTAMITLRISRIREKLVLSDVVIEMLIDFFDRQDNVYSVVHDPLTDIIEFLHEQRENVKLSAKEEYSATSDSVRVARPLSIDPYPYGFPSTIPQISISTTETAMPLLTENSLFSATTLEQRECFIQDSIYIHQQESDNPSETVNTTILETATTEEKTTDGSNDAASKLISSMFLGIT